MAKKIILTIILSLVAIVAFSTISLAESNNTTTTLGNEVTSSMNKTERSMNDLVDRTNLDKAGQTIENGARAIGNVVNDGLDGIGKGIEDLTDEDEMKSENTAVAGTTRNYNAGQTRN